MNTSSAFDYKNPDYAAIFAERARRLAKLRANPELVLAARTWYRTHPWDFINDWGVTFDPRNPERGLPALMPFVLWQKQVEFVQWLHARWLASERGACEKSRDCGVTWLAVGFAVSMWLFVNGFTAGFGSRKEELVDKRGDDKSIFEKLRTFIEYVPTVFMPTDWDPRTCSAHMRIVHPETQAALIGEVGDHIGRGGRAQPLDAKILTPDGWTTMGEIRVGSFVTGADGYPAQVSGVFPQGVEQVYRVTFTDGSSTECSAGHLWQVTTPKIRKSLRRAASANPENRSGRHAASVDCEVLRLDEIDGALLVDRPGQIEFRYHIPMMQPARFSQVELPLDPYLLGALLGDGSISQIDHTSVGFTTADREMIDLLRDRAPPGVEIRSDGTPYGYRLMEPEGRRGPGVRNAIKAPLYQLGLDGSTSATKFIPEVYKRAPAHDRLQLLRGLMDTDGWAHDRGASGTRAKLASISLQLMRDAQDIVRSLGGTATMTTKRGAERTFPNDRTYACADSFELSLSLPPGMCPFLLLRKASRYRDRQKYQPKRAIASIEPIGEKATQCICVDRHLYVTDDYIVTHNSSMYFVDEAAYVEHQMLVDSALSANTNVQIDISSVFESGSPFHQKRIRYENTDRLFIFDWTDDPRKDAAWLAKQQAELDPIIVAREIMRDWSAGTEDAFILGKWVDAAIDAHKKLGIRPEGIRVTGFDPADVGDAKACVFRHGSVILEAAQQREKDGDITTAIPWAFELADRLRSDVLRFDADGLGAPSLKLALLHRAASRFKVMPFYGSGEVEEPNAFYDPIDPENAKDPLRRTNANVFQNYRAQAWTWSRDRFKATYDAIERIKKGFVVNVNPDQLISIDSACTDLQQLKTELSRPKRIWTGNGLIRVESKPEMKKRSIPSPNLADALVMAVATKRPEVKRNAPSGTPRRQPYDQAMGL